MTSIRKAEDKALAGDNESQDSQQVLDAYMETYGVGTMSTSPVPGEVNSRTTNVGLTPSKKKQVTYSHKENFSRSKAPVPITRHAPEGGTTDNEVRLRVRLSSSIGVAGRGDDSRSREQDPEAENFEAENAAADVHLAEASPRLVDHTDTDGPGNVDVPPKRPPSSTRRKKMDSSQSPTQSNDGRSYEQYFRTSSPGVMLDDDEAGKPGELPGKSYQEPAALDEDDPGAVRLSFDEATRADEATPSIVDESGLVDFGSVARLRDLASQNQSDSPRQQLPETPAPPVNPFRQSKSQLLPPSQLFGGTQFSSAIKRPASPTSSRPSPNDFHRNSTPRPIISSPLKARGLRSSPLPGVISSPQILPGTTSPRVADGPSSPVNTASTKNPVVPESPRFVKPQKKSVPGPMSSYEPMRKSQERRSTPVLRSEPDSIGEDLDDDVVDRRRKARARQQAALKQLTAITFNPPTKSDDIEVPSTNKRKKRTQAEDYIAQCHGTSQVEENEEATQEAVADSQEGRIQPVQDPPSQGEESTHSHADEDEKQETESIPDTAPSGLPAEEMAAPILSQRLNAAETPNLTQHPSAGEAIPETSPAERRPVADAETDVEEIKEPPPSLPSMKAVSGPDFQSSPPAFSTRLRRANANTAASKQKIASSSSLSNLASTPQLTMDATPATEDTAVTKPTVSGKASTNSSPAVAKSKRRESREKVPQLKTASTENIRQSARLARRMSNSTDELAKSPASAITPITFEHSLRASRLSASRLSISTSKSARTASKVHQGRLFEGMAFAISFQGRKDKESNDQYHSRTEFATTIEKRIKAAGGRILENGFDELFEMAPVRSANNSTPRSTPMSESDAGEGDIHLTPQGASTGFTALIADGHSRKVKYMQALSLGLPCIAARWITSCLDKNELVDWSPYLLCAGQSAFLGDAIRSRNLQPYDAGTAKLADIVSQRTKLLEGSRILLVMKKTLEGKKMAYVFLARVLGASLSRVYSAEEARAELKAAEDSGQPFDWVYVDGKPDQWENLAAGQEGGRKRKRQSAVSMTEPPTKRIRTLSDELVIQSLILGRLIEEGEMES
ncbi:DNA repair protein crb2 [Diplogelasinospora grovesii]|uniref:DNA repair protein crb2 n=1 Tax=Diplogelasinospora grovesii TaxID=303347 RepID=A0AAN6NKQ1_9PEZI|nr:DNA repair protein crb2 [Diplogelasinospora grovesii]